MKMCTITFIVCNCWDFTLVTLNSQWKRPHSSFLCHILLASQSKWCHNNKMHCRVTDVNNMIHTVFFYFTMNNTLFLLTDI